METAYPFDLKNKVVVVTGGYGHLGKAIVSGLAIHGAYVWVLGRHKKKFTEAFKESNKNIEFIEGDVSSSESVMRALSSIADQTGRIDTLVNNAFYLEGKSPESMSDHEWENGMEGTLGSVFRCIRAVMPIMKKQGYGKIINVSSMYGLVAPDFSIYNDAPEFLNPPHYGAAKAGVLQLTRYYAGYLGSSGITVNSVTPGPFPSAAVQENRDFIEKLKERTLLKRIGRPEDLAGAFVFLASDAADFITGQNIVVDGGWTVR